MKRLTLAAVVLLLAATPAFADTFNFTFGDPTIPPFHSVPASGSGQFTAAPITGSTYAGPAFLVTGVTGNATFNGVSTAITGIAPLGAGFQGNDNILFFPPISGFNFDGHGTAFTLGNGVIVDLYAAGGIYLTIPGQPAFPETGPISVTAATTPEPSSRGLLATGCLTLVVRARRRLGRLGGDTGRQTL